MTDYRDIFSEHILISNVSGSGKASSYIRALDLLCEMIKVKPYSFKDCENIWTISSVDRLQDLYEFVLDEARKNESSLWCIAGIPKSYLQSGYCSAAIKAYQEFLIEYSYEKKIFSVLDSNISEDSNVLDRLDLDLEYPSYLLEGLDNVQGQDVIRLTRTRSNQNVFRKMILKIYNQSCCITGLDIPEINRASHIIPWAEDEKKRLDPSNGLCLSATYDAAFDRYLISLDDDYRIIISNDLSDHYTSKIVNEYFNSKEGDKITLPKSYKPKKDYLADHRSKGNF